MWGRRTKISNDMDLAAAPYTSEPTDHVAPTGNGSDGWWPVTFHGEVWDELHLVLKTDVSTSDVTPFFYVPDFDRDGDPKAGSVIPGRMEENIPATATADKGRIFRIPVPIAATHVRLYAADLGAGALKGAIYACEETH